MKTPPIPVTLFIRSPCFGTDHAELLRRFDGHCSLFCYCLVFRIITARRCSHCILKSRDECAGAVVTNFQCSSRNVFTGCKQTECVQHAQLLSPFSKSHLRFSLKQSFDSSFARADFLCQTIQRFCVTE